MGVDPRDFRLWVCLHEETHRVQFGAVPWLRDHMMGELRAFVDATDVDPAALAARVKAAAAAAYGAMREGVDPPDGDSSGPSLVEAVQTPAQREILDRITALMSLLEGHADYVMDGVGPSVIPSVAAIRAQFQAPAQAVRPGRAGGAPAARHRRQAAAVPRRRALRPRGRRAGRDGRLQPGLGLAGQPAHQGRDRRPGRLGRAGRHPRELPAAAN